MRTPLWIITSSLAIVLAVLLAFIVYSLRTLFVPPTTASIITKRVQESDKKTDAKPADLQVIYEEHDLFSTYRPSVTPVEPVETLPKIPSPPSTITKVRKKPSPIQFLEPLPLKITGIIASSNEAKSQVSLLNNNTGKTESFRVGDKIQDAYLLRIFPRKIIIIRSNGQQETLYMYPEDAKHDTDLMKDTNWTEVIQQKNERTYLLNPIAFASRIRSLAELIEMLDLTTASKNGSALGLRIGTMQPTSIGLAAGFQPGDIITYILDMKPTTTHQRITLFNEIVSSDLETHIPVQFLRNDQVHSVTFILYNLADPAATLEEEGIQPISRIPSANNQVAQFSTLERSTGTPFENKSGARTVKQINIDQPQESRKRNLDAMKKYGGKSAQLLPPSTSTG